jgi:hypothetical protein
MEERHWRQDRQRGLCNFVHVRLLSGGRLDYDGVPDGSIKHP